MGDRATTNGKVRIGDPAQEARTAVVCCFSAGCLVGGQVVIAALGAGVGFHFILGLDVFAPLFVVLLAVEGSQRLVYCFCFVSFWHGRALARCVWLRRT